MTDSTVERLASLRRIAEADIACEQCTDVDPSQLLALVECVMAAQQVASKRRCRIGGGSNLSDKNALDNLDAALAKWDAL